MVQIQQLNANMHRMFEKSNGQKMKKMAQLQQYRIGGNLRFSFGKVWMQRCTAKAKLNALTANYPQKEKQPTDTTEDATIRYQLHRLLARRDSASPAEAEMEDTESDMRPASKGKVTGKGKAEKHGELSAAAVAENAQRRRAFAAAQKEAARAVHAEDAEDDFYDVFN